MSVKEIKAAISRLTTEQLTELRIWLDEYAAQRWDDQIENDLAAGRLDRLLTEVDEECGRIPR